MSPQYHLITRAHEDGLTKVEYRYWMRESSKAEFDWTAHYIRTTRRHSWRVVKYWSRLNLRSSTMEREEPPQDVKDEVRERIMDALTFC